MSFKLLILKSIVFSGVDVVCSADIKGATRGGDYPTVWLAEARLSVLDFGYRMGTESGLKMHHAEINDIYSQ